MPKKINYKKIIGFWLLVFLVGGLSGVFFSRAFLPWLASFSPFNKVAWLCNVNDATTIINKTERVYISQETAYQEAINKVGNAAVAVLIGAKPIAGSGFILTGDGLIATANFSAPKGSKILVMRNDKRYEARLIKQDKANNLALLKIDANNLPVADFSDSGSLRLGEKVFLAGAAMVDGAFSKFANVGFVKSLTPEISFTFSDSFLAGGAPLGDINGKVLGMILVDGQGSISLVGGEKVRELMK